MKLRTKTIWSFLLSALLFSAAPGSAADSLFTRRVGRCVGTLETDVVWKVATLRFLHPEGERCEISEDALAGFLDEGFSEKPLSEEDAIFESVFIGRAIEFPWMSRLLAEKASGHPGWDGEKGRPLEGGVNEFVAGILGEEEFLSVFSAALGKAGYEVRGVSAEKVAVSSPDSDRHPPWTKGLGKAPYDALVWLIVAPVR